MRSSSFEDVLSLVRHLRSAEGCEWDRAQTPESLLPYLIEECYEVREAILQEAPHELAAELGDLALHLAFQAVIAEERGAFEPHTIFAGVVKKMVGRHPQVFGPADAAAGSARETAAGPDAHLVQGDAARGEGGDAPPGFGSSHAHWEQRKLRERAHHGGEAGLLDGIPLALPGLLKAQRMQERAAAVGFDWSDPAGALEKVREELHEVASQLGEAPGERPAPRDPLTPPDRRALEDEIGDLLFAVVNLARKAELVAEDALERSSAKFRRRFEALEALARERRLDLATAGLERLDQLWDEVTRGEDTGRALEPAEPSGARPKATAGPRLPNSGATRDT
jgi:uncharacterized protein YabN with tetrapyrrole methylase and pyrophosphatase domain